MRKIHAIAAAVLANLALAAPAHASALVALPDPSGITLFTLGVTGLIVGRQIARKRKD